MLNQRETEDTGVIAARPVVTITELAGVDEAVRIVCRELGRFAAKGKLPRLDGNAPYVRQFGPIEIWFDPREDHVGEAWLRFITKDNKEVKVPVNFTQLTREYLDEIVQETGKAINEHRAASGALHLVPFTKKPTIPQKGA